MIPGVFSIFVHQLLNGAQSWYIRWRIAPNTQFQKEDFPTSPGAEKVLILLRCLVPALILYEGIIAAEVHGQWFSTVWADREKFCRDFHIFLLHDHFRDYSCFGFSLKVLYLCPCILFLRDPDTGQQLLFPQEPLTGRRLIP